MSCSAGTPAHHFCGVLPTLFGVSVATGNSLGRGHSLQSQRGSSEGECVLSAEPEPVFLTSFLLASYCVPWPTPCPALCGHRVTLDDLPGDRLLPRARLSRSPPGWLHPRGISSLVTSRAGTCARGTKDTPRHMCCGHLGTRGVRGMTSGLLIQNGTLPFESRLSKQAPPTPRSPQHSAPTSLPGPVLWLLLAPLVAHGSSSPADGAQLSSLTLIAYFSFPIYPYNHVWIGGRPILQVERRDSAIKSVGCGQPNSSSQVLTTPPQSPPRTLEISGGNLSPSPALLGGGRTA